MQGDGPAGRRNGARAGLSVRLDEAHHYDIEVAGGEVSVLARIGPVRQCLARRPVPAGPLTLVVEIRTTSPVPPTATSVPGPEPPGIRSGGPDTVVLSVEDGSVGAGEPLAELDGRYLSTQVAGGFTGRVIGMYVTEGSASFDWFTYLPSGSS